MTKDSPGKVVKTGRCKEWSTNGINDLAGNVDEWTQEKNKSSYRVIRGGNFGNCGDGCPVAYRDYYGPGNGYGDTGFRAALFLA